MIREAVCGSPRGKVWGDFRTATDKAVGMIVKELRDSDGYPDAATSADVADNLPGSIVASSIVKFETGGATR